MHRAREWTIDRRANDGSPPHLPGPIRARPHRTEPRRRVLVAFIMAGDASGQSTDRGTTALRRRCRARSGPSPSHEAARRGLDAFMMPGDASGQSTNEGCIHPSPFAESLLQAEDQLDPAGLRRPAWRGVIDARLLTRAAGEGDRPTGPAFGRPDDRLRRWRGQGRARSRGQGRRPSDQSRGAPATVRVAAPSTMLRMVPSPARAGEDRAIAGLHPARSHRTKRRQRGLDREPATKVNDRQTRAAFILRRSRSPSCRRRPTRTHGPSTRGSSPAQRGRGTAEGGGGGKDAHGGGARAAAERSVPQRSHHGARDRPLHHASHGPPPPLRG
jgi:hypothetical protein